MDNNSAQNSGSDIQEMNVIKDRILNESWENLKSDSRLIREALRPGEHANAGDMLLMERVLLLSDLFENSQIIPREKFNPILESFASADLNNLSKLKTDTDLILPGLIINTKADFNQLQTWARQLVNGLSNIRKIAQLQMAGDLIPNISLVKKISLAQIEQSLDAISQIEKKFFTQPGVPPTERPTEDYKEIAELLAHLGRSNFEINDLLEKNPSELAFIIGDVKESLKITKLAYDKNLVNQLDDIYTVANLLAETQKTP